MSTISIVYFTGTGHTGTLAEAVSQGAAAVLGVTTNLIAISGEDIAHLSPAPLRLIVPARVLFNL